MIDRFDMLYQLDALSSLALSIASFYALATERVRVGIIGAVGFGGLGVVAAAHTVRIAWKDFHLETAHSLINLFATIVVLWVVVRWRVEDSRAPDKRDTQEGSPDGH